jgi:hypothetical protein
MGVAWISFRSASTRSILESGIYLLVAVIQQKLSSRGEVLLKDRSFTGH